MVMSINTLRHMTLHLKGDNNLLGTLATLHRILDFWTYDYRALPFHGLLVGHHLSGLSGARLLCLPTGRKLETRLGGQSGFTRTIYWA